MRSQKEGFILLRQLHIGVGILFNPFLEILSEDCSKDTNRKFLNLSTGKLIFEEKSL